MVKPERGPRVWADINAAAREENAGLSLRHAVLACARALSAVGAGVSLNRDGGEPNEPILATSVLSEGLEELQYTLGEGPCRDVVGVMGAVLVADLGGIVAAQRWPMFAATAAEQGVRAMFVFPMRIGTARLGVLSVYRAQAGPLRPRELTDGLAYAEAATSLALDGRGAAADLQQVIEAAFASRRAEVHQAAGMVAAGTHVTVTDALALMRGHAYGSARGLHEVAADIVAGRLVLRTDGVDSG